MKDQENSANIARKDFSSQVKLKPTRSVVDFTLSMSEDKDVWFAIILVQLMKVQSVMFYKNTMTCTVAS